MNFLNWYTDLMDVYRVVPTLEGSLTRHTRQQVLSAIPCRIYQSDNKAPTMTPTAAEINEQMKVSCDNSVNVLAGDELIITRGGAIGQTTETIRAFAGDANHYYEPFGAVIPGLAHQQIRLLKQERIQAGAEVTP